MHAYLNQLILIILLFRIVFNVALIAVSCRPTYSADLVRNFTKSDTFSSKPE